jgi:pimeloyl-ACP methyl ester carboxylesterase
VVLVQGLGLPGRMWLGLPGGLAKSGHLTVTPDTRGTGLSDAPAPPYSMRTLAADLAAVILDVDQGPAIVLGISMGGMVAQHLALTRPELVRGLVLAATTCGLPHGKLPNLRFAWLVFLSVVGDEEAAVEKIHRMLVHEDSLERNPRLFDEWDREQQGCAMPWQGVLGHLSAAITHSTGPVLSKLQCPTVVVAGAQDRIIPPENSRILAERIRGAELFLVPETGHAFPLEQPAALPSAIRRVQQRCRR